MQVGSVLGWGAEVALVLPTRNQQSGPQQRSGSETRTSPQAAARGDGLDADGSSDPDGPACLLAGDQESRRGSSVSRGCCGCGQHDRSRVRCGNAGADQYSRWQQVRGVLASPRGGIGQQPGCDDR